MRLFCLDADARDTHLEVVWDREIDARIVDGASWRLAAERGVDPFSVLPLIA